MRQENRRAFTRVYTLSFFSADIREDVLVCDVSLSTIVSGNNYPEGEGILGTNFQTNTLQYINRTMCKKLKEEKIQKNKDYLIKLN